MVKKSVWTKLLIIALTVFGLTVNTLAQSVEDVTLTVSGDGITKKAATDIALRSALEQAFGVFVSANTSILNDALVKDEIATVSSGNIKKYEEIASLPLPNGNTSVTLKVIVSISKLVKYAENHGSAVEFAGATFGANMKLKELNKTNEEKAIENMIFQLKALTPLMFDYKLEMGEPKTSMNGDNYVIDSKIFVTYNDYTEKVNSTLLNILSSLSLTKEEMSDYKAVNMKFYKLDIGNFYFNRSSNDYVPKIVNFKKLIIDERGYYNTNFLREYIKESFDFENIHRTSSDLVYYFRSSKTIKQLGYLVNILISNGIYSFNIKDNTGQISMIERSSDDKEIQSYKYSGIISKTTQPILGFLELRGWLYPDIQFQNDFHFMKMINNGTIAIPHLYKDKLVKKDGLPICYVIGVTLSIPKEDISKYSKFTIEHNQTTH